MYKKTYKINEYVKQVHRPIEYYIQYIRVLNKDTDSNIFLHKTLKLVILRIIMNVICFRVLTLPQFSENRELFETGNGQTPCYDLT